MNNPPQKAVNNLPDDELQKILETMENQPSAHDSQLKLNRKAWLNEVERVRALYRSTVNKNERNIPQALVVIA